MALRGRRAILKVRAWLGYESPSSPHPATQAHAEQAGRGAFAAGADLYNGRRSSGPGRAAPFVVLPGSLAAIGRRIDAGVDGCWYSARQRRDAVEDGRDADKGTGERRCRVGEVH